MESKKNKNTPETKKQGRPKSTTSKSKELPKKSASVDKKVQEKKPAK